MRSSIALPLALLLAGAATASPQQRVERMEVELEGPLALLRLSVGEAPSTTIAVELEAGERRSLVVPFLSGEAGPVARPHLDPGPEGGTARVIEESRSGPTAWDSLPWGLRRRPRPVVAPPPPSPGTARLFWVAAALLLVVGLRRRPAVSLACGAVAAAGIWILPAPEVPESAILVLETDRGSDRGLEVRGAIGTLPFPGVAPGWLRCTPPTAEAAIVGVERDGELRWSFHAPGARLHFARELPGAVERRLETLIFSRVWARDPGGGWHFRESWEPAAGHDAPGPGSPPPPPGWLASGLPQGIPVQLGEAVDRLGQPVWVRSF